MKRVVSTGVGALLALAIVVPGMAVGGMLALDNDFEGRVEGDPLTYFGFDLNGSRDRRKVAKVTAQLRYACTNGDEGPADVRVKGKLRVDDDRFAGTLRRTGEAVARVFAARGGSPARVKYRIRGKFTTKRKAKGSVDAEIRFREMKTRGGQLVRCYTGKVDWKARRGADIEPVIPMR